MNFFVECTTVLYIVKYRVFYEYIYGFQKKNDAKKILTNNNKEKWQILGGFEGKMADSSLRVYIS